MPCRVPLSLQHPSAQPCFKPKLPRASEPPGADVRQELPSKLSSVLKKNSSNSSEQMKKKPQPTAGDAAWVRAEGICARSQPLPCRKGSGCLSSTVFSAFRFCWASGQREICRQGPTGSGCRSPHPPAARNPFSRMDAEHLSASVTFSPLSLQPPRRAKCPRGGKGTKPQNNFPQVLSFQEQSSPSVQVQAER